MSSQERWTVYPLLLLAIGLAVRGNIGLETRVPSLTAGGVTADAIVCKEMAIVTDDGQIIVHAGRVEGGGGGCIEIHDAEGKDALALGTSPKSRDGAIEFFNAAGKSLLRLEPRPVSPRPETTP